MYAAVRRYQVNPKPSGEVPRKIFEECAQRLVEEVPGLQAYYLLDAQNGVIATIAICESQEALEECSRLAAEWMKQYLAESILGMDSLENFFVEVVEPLEGVLHVGVAKDTPNPFPPEGKELPHRASSSPPASQEEKLLSVKEVCEELGMGKSWVYRYLRSGEIPSLRVGRNIKVRQKDLEEYLERHRYSSLNQERPPASKS